MIIFPKSVPGHQSVQPPRLFKMGELLVAILVFCCLQLTPNLSHSEEIEKLVIFPFEMVDNIPSPGSEERNEQMLKKITLFIGDKIMESDLFKVVDQDKVNNLVSAAQLGTEIRNCNQCEFDLARQAKGDKVMIGWVYKMSLLILTMHIEIKDVSGEQTIVSKAYDFRGDNERAWLRAAKYMVQDLNKMFTKS